MTNEEAIRNLQDIKTYTLSTGADEAIDMAIEALKAQPDVPDTNVGDTISKQAAIDEEGLDEEIRCQMCKNQMKTDKGCDGNCKYDEKLYEKIIQILNRRIKSLPPAQPTLYGYNIEQLELIARVLQKENLPPERIVEALTDIGRIVAIVRDEYEEALRRAVDQCVT